MQRTQADTMQSSTRVQFLQNGTLLSVDIPGFHNAGQTERLQEIAQNTALGTTNLISSMSNSTINALRNYHFMFKKIVGGPFDGLSEGEAQWLRYQGWTEDRQWFDRELSEDEVYYLCTQNLLKVRFASSSTTPVQSNMPPRVYPASQKGPETKNPETDLATLADLVNSSEPLPALTSVAKSVGVIGYGRSLSSDTQPVASSASSLPGIVSPSVATSSSSPIKSFAVPESVISGTSQGTSPSLSPHAELLDMSTPKDETMNVGCPDSEKEAWKLQDAMFNHLFVHSWPCYFECNYNPVSGRYELPDHWLQAQTPPDSPISDISGTDTNVDESYVFVDWEEKELETWLKGQQEDLEMDRLLW